MTETTELFTTEQAANMAGVTVRQLNYWVQRRIVTPTVQAEGSGYRHKWTGEDIQRLVDVVRRIEACPFHRVRRR